MKCLKSVYGENANAANGNVVIAYQADLFIREMSDK
jgi:hypothetical protein